MIPYEDSLRLSGVDPALPGLVEFYNDYCSNIKDFKNIPADLISKFNDQLYLEEDFKYYLIFLGSFGWAVDCALISQFLINLNPNKRFVGRGEYYLITRFLDRRDKIEEVLSVVSEKLSKKIVMSGHGLFSPFLSGRESEIFGILNKFSADLLPYGYKIIPFYGTLLGLVRDKRILHHDDDIDLLILPSDTSDKNWSENLNEFEAKTSVLGIEYKNRLDGHVHIKYANSVQFDIFFPCVVGEEYRIKSYITKLGYFSFKKNELLELEKKSMPGYDLMIPVKSDVILEKIYGSNWMVEDKYFAWPWSLKDEVVK